MGLHMNHSNKMKITFTIYGFFHNVYIFMYYELIIIYKQSQK